MRGYAEKLCPVFPDRSVLADEPHVGLVHQRGGLQRVVTAFSPKVRSRAAVELPVHDGHQFITRCGVALAPRLQQGGHIRRSLFHFPAEPSCRALTQGSSGDFLKAPPRFS